LCKRASFSWLFSPAIPGDSADGNPASAILQFT
jgi:hypothetical protein